MMEQIQTTEQKVAAIFAQVKANAKRLKELGKWQKRIDEEESLLERIPGVGDDNAAGFDAGIACSLDLIPRDRQILAATLHAGYTAEAVAQVRSELQDLHVDDETCWWLAGCSICIESNVDQEKFLQQIADFKTLISDKEKMLATAKAEYAKMIKLFYFIPELGPDVAYGTVDGCMQGAYIAGFPVAVQYIEQEKRYSLGTYLPSLGLEGFEWSKAVDESGKPKSGPVHGSTQFVKCADLKEVQRALALVKKKILNN